MVASSGDFHAGLRAAIGLPLAHMAYSVGFWRGFLGSSLSDVSPGRFWTRPPRILILNWRDVTHPWAGGAESYMHQIARRWVRNGCEVGWVSERYRTGKRVEMLDGIRFHRLGGQFTVYPFAAFAYLLRLRKRYDIIIDCENGIPFFTPLFSRKPVVLVVHHLHQEVFRRELPFYMRWLAVWLEGWLMPRVYRENPVVAVSPSTLSELEIRGYDPAHMTIITNGVEVPSKEEIADRNGTPLLLCLGRLKRYKSVDVLLRAMPAILAKFADVELSIVGQGPEREPLERLAWSLGLASKVRFYGYLPVEAKNNLLSRGWITICPSAFEGWGVVCLEASAWGRPVVAARVPGLRDAVIDGETGCLVPYGDSAALASQVITLLGDGQRREAMGCAGRNWAREHDWDTSAASFLKVVVAYLQPSAERNVVLPLEQQEALSGI
jgi:glycosyltransferase involved in cell wall biosynthesis